MSKQSQEAQDRRREEAAAIRESDIRELTPKPGTDEAKNVREQVQSLGEAPELLSFEEAMAEVRTVEDGNNKAADRLSHKYGNKQYRYIKRIPTAPDGEPGWHCEMHPKSPLTPEQSQELADAINEKIDADQMKLDAKRNKAAREQKKARKAKPREQTEERADNRIELLAKMDEAVKHTDDLNALNEIVLFCHRHNLLKVEFKGKHWKKASGISELENSHELAQEINSRKKQFLREIGREKEVIRKLIEEIEYSLDIFELGKMAWKKLHRKGYIIKRFTGEREIDWVAERVKGKHGSKEITEAVSKRYEELLREYKEAQAQKTRKEADRILNKVRR